MRAKDKVEDYEIIDYHDEIIGRTFSGKYGNFIVLGATNKRIHSNKLFACEFLDSGYINLYSKQVILKGSPFDPYYPNVANIACSGVVSPNHFLYKTWNDMIHRCYDDSDGDYKYYGLKGIKTSKRWLCFEYFIEDAYKIKGWDEEKVKNGELQIDKDKSNEGLYSLKTCEWIPKKENIDIANVNQIIKQKMFKATNIKSGECIITQGVNRFAREHGMGAGNIGLVLKGKYKQCKGWKFEWLEEEASINN